ncbi:MAG: RelA/SpoT family protein [Neisseriaceae bacterium]
MVTVKQNFYDVSSWIENQRQHFDESEIKQFLKAIEIAEIYYKDKYFYPTNIDLLKHALRCANTIASLNLYSDAVIATIFFALPRYCDKWQEELSIFDTKVSELVDGVNKVTQIRKLGSLADVDNEAEKKEQIETIRKMLLAMASDIRVVLIVLVGRGELMLNLESCPDEDMRKKIALETVEIFSPLANRLGVWQIKWELEDLSFKYLHRDQYKKIAKLLDETREERLEYIERIKEFLSSQMEQGGITDYQVTGRAKHIYSIWRKMKKKSYDFDDLYDIRALRVLVPEVRDCYVVLGIVHTKYTPIPGEFDDYISNPKSNNYQSLHTCVIGPEDKVVEIQIRTFAMHDHAEYGIAAHWRYKEFGEKAHNSSSIFAEKVAWLRQLLDWREELADRKDIADIFKNEIFSDTIYVMTPNGKVISLPHGATPIDFAYAVHSDVGNKCRGAKINGHIVPLSTPLKNGQRIEILTIKEGGPSINWLHEGWVKSTKAISHIRRYIRNLNNEEFYQAGHEMFEREISKIHANVRPSAHDIVSKMNYENEKVLCIDLGKGEVAPHQIRDAINKLIYKDTSLKKQEINYANFSEQISKTKQTKIFSGILVDGVTGIVTNIAKCCKPIPGDDIIGFITQGKGIAVHRASCSSLKRQAKSAPNKVIKVEWSGHDIINTTFNVDIEIVAHDRSGLLRDITDFFSIEKLQITALRTICKHNKTIMLFTIQIKTIEFHFEWLINKLFGIAGVTDVYRK